MANLKEVRTRIASTQSTQQITKAMKMVSATKLRKAQQAITQMRPYAEKLNGILQNLSDTAKDEPSIQGYFEHREVKNVLLVVNSSDRGLCGGFNSNITKEVTSLIEKTYQGKNVEVKFLGKKAYEFFKRHVKWCSFCLNICGCGDYDSRDQLCKRSRYLTSCSWYSFRYLLCEYSSQPYTT